MVRQLFLRSGVYFSGLVAVKLLSTVLFIFLARFLQPELFGKFAYFMTLLSLLTVVSDWGLVQWFQIHRTNGNEDSLINQVTNARLFTLCISAIIFILYVSISRVFSIYESILFLILLFPEAITSVVDGYYLVRRRSPVIALKQFSKYLFPVLYILFFKEVLTVEGVIWVFLISSIFTAIWYVPRKYWNLSQISLEKIKTTLKGSSAYALLILTSAFYSRGDAVILETKLGHAVLGLYSAGYRYLDAMSLFPAAFSQNLFHISSQHGVIHKSRVLTMTAVMGGIGLVFGGFLYLFSNFLTVGLLGQAYAGSEIIVKIFGVVTVLLFINSPLSTLVQSSTLVKKFLPWGIMNTFLNISLNVLIIPIAGGVGAAFVMLLTEATGLLINLYFVKLRLQQK